MANYFIGGVGRVRAFVNTEKGLEHYFDAKTLTDSAINISVSAEEIRGGEGAKLVGKYFHSSNFTLNMTDPLLDLKYIAAQVGSNITEDADGTAFKTEKLQIKTGGKVTLTETPVAISENVTWCQEGASTIAWYKGCDDTEYQTAIVTKTADNKYQITVAGQVNDYVCVSYPITKKGRQIVVKAMYYPKEFVIYLTAKLFAGDACKPSTGTSIGEIVVEIPRFQLDGTVDIGLNMSSPATFALNGSAYAVGCGCDDEDGSYYAKITEVLTNEADVYGGYTNIVVLNSENLKVGDEVFVYAVATGKTPKLYRGEFSAKYTNTTEQKDALNEAGEIVAGAATKEVTITILDGSLKNKTAKFTPKAA
nr:MAG TPA: structural protein [Caudoviricetes sp.]